MDDKHESSPEAVDEPAYRDILVKQVEAKNYCTFHINGAFASMNPHGELFVGLYNDHDAVASTTMLRLHANGVTENSPLAELPGQHILLREVQAGCFMSLEAAASLGEWLLDRVAAYSQINAEVRAELEKGGLNDDAIL